MLSRVVALTTLLLGAACDHCPPTTEMEGGTCVPVATGGGSEEPVTADNFQQKFNIRRCQAAESCLVEEGYDRDFWGVECDTPWEWDDTCPFDVGAAERCLDSDWACDSWPGVIVTIPSSACDDVYRCN